MHLIARNTDFHQCESFPSYSLQFFMNFSSMGLCKGTAASLKSSSHAEVESLSGAWSTSSPSFFVTLVSEEIFLSHILRLTLFDI